MKITFLGLIVLEMSTGSQKSQSLGIKRKKKRAAVGTEQGAGERTIPDHQAFIT